MNDQKQTVAVLGASAKPERYANQAVRLLLEKGHNVIPVHPALKQIEGLDVVSRLAEIQQPVDTLTLYVGPARGEKLISDMLVLHPERVILNPGTESETIASALGNAGIQVEQACTLVLLRTGQF
jgi:predicted CoA-binding protein